MDMKRKVPSSYEDFQPSSEWKKAEESETLVISLPGFKKEQLKVQMDNQGNLRVSGECPLDGEHWSRFRKDFRIPQNTRTSDIRAKFENGNLSVILPKLIKKTQPQNKPTKAEEPESGNKTTMEREPRQDQDHINKKDSSLSSSKSNGGTPKQSNGKSGGIGESLDTRKNAPTIQEKEKDVTHKSEDKQQPARDNGDKDAELPSSRKRKTEEETFHDGGSILGMRFKRPRQLMLNVGVAAVILVGLAIYVSYKLRKSIEADSN